MAHNKKIEEVIPEPSVDTEVEQDSPEPPVDTQIEDVVSIAISIDTAIVALEVAKEQAVCLLGTDIEHLFEPIEVALGYKAKQTGSDESFAGLSAEEAALKQLEEKEAAIVAMQEAAGRLLDAAYSK